MNELSVAFYVALSHTSLGLVPLVASVLLGTALILLHRRRRELRERWTLPTVLLLWPFFLIGLWFTFAAIAHVGCAALMARQAACRDVLKELGVAAMQYTQDHNGVFPSADRWEKDLQPYLKQPLHCPSVTSGTGYAMNRNLSKKKLDDLDIPALTVLFFETDNGTDVAKQRHGRRPHFVCADGHLPSSLGRSSQDLIWTLSAHLDISN